MQKSQYKTGKSHSENVGLSGVEAWFCCFYFNELSVIHYVSKLIGCLPSTPLRVTLLKYSLLG